MKLILIYVALFAYSICTETETVTWDLENYNGWNLPFKKTIEIEALDKGVNFPLSNYNLEVDPSAYFSVIFTDLDIKKVEDPVSLNYTFYGERNFEANGTWTEMRMNFNGDYNITVKVFLAYS